MIASIRGILKQKMSDSCVIEAGGLGYEVFLTQAALASLPAQGENVEFFTHFHLREDAQQLFGFSTQEEKRLFLLLLDVKGVGPKLGMSVLSQLGTRDLVEALKRRDLARLGSASGVGKKLAERMAVELSDKVLPFQGGPPGRGGHMQGPQTTVGPESRAVQALVALGIPLIQSRSAVSKAMEQLDGSTSSATVEVLVTIALKNL